jgi:hypothetical protein
VRDLFFPEHLVFIFVSVKILNALHFVRTYDVALISEGKRNKKINRREGKEKKRER